MAILQSMSTQYESIQKINADIVFIERSPESSLVFARNSYNLGGLSTEELDLFNQYRLKFGFKPHMTIKLNTSPDECFKRIICRARPCEKAITLEYLKGLAKEYVNISGIELDGSLSSAELANYVEQICSNKK